MGKHGSKFNTAFSPGETTAIQSEIKALGTLHNRLIRDTFELDIDDLRHTVLPPEVREFVLEVEKHYRGDISQSNYACRVRAPNMDLRVGEGVARIGGVYAGMGWWNHNGRFPLPDNLSDKYLQLHDDARPEVVEKYEALCRDWVMSGLNYGLLMSVFDWLNEFCAKGDRVHVRTLLPNVVSLIRKHNPDLAGKLARPLGVGASREPLPADRRDAVVRANQIIAEGLMLPVIPSPPRQISLALNASEKIVHPLWPESVTLHLSI